MKAANEFVQVEIKNLTSPKGFQVNDNSLLRGKVLSCGANVSNIKKAQTVLFPAIHGKVMVDTQGGTLIYYVHEDVILAVE